jgi:hypothetical protein
MSMARTVRRSVRSVHSVAPSERETTKGELLPIYRLGDRSLAWVPVREQIDYFARAHGYTRWEDEPPRHELEVAQDQIDWIYCEAGPGSFAWQVLRPQIAFLAGGGAERAVWARPHRRARAAHGRRVPG